MNLQQIDISLYDYALPVERIARYPVEKREDAKLLVYRSAKITQNQFHQLPQLLDSNDFLVFNDSKVVPARILFTKQSGAVIEILCIEPHDPANYQQSFDKVGKVQWKCFVGNMKRWKDEKIALHFNHNGNNNCLYAKLVHKVADIFIVEFTWNGLLKFYDLLQLVGHLPIPPYLSRQEQQCDKERYQTVYANIKGSVAAPTAGLHFNSKMFDELLSRNIQSGFITLHVGAGTFIPVKACDARDHQMHQEHLMISKAMLINLLNNHESITAVGTTSVRALETIYWMGVKQYINKPPYNELKQWEGYELKEPISVKDSLNALITMMDDRQMDILQVSTQIMIVPGYKFRVVKKIITNFHQPRSTLILLIAAFLGNNSWRDVYQFALDNQFRFLSYGDSSLLIP